MKLRNMTVQSKLAAAFGGLAALVLLVSALAVRALGQGHDDYAGYVGDTGARLALANDVLDAANARAVAARNLVLVTTETDREAEKVAVTKAHEKVNASVTKLKEAIAKTGDAEARERMLFAALECPRRSNFDPPGVRTISWTTWRGSSCTHTKIVSEP